MDVKAFREAATNYRQVFGYIKNYLGKYDLTPMEWILLDIIVEYPGQSMTYYKNVMKVTMPEITAISKNMIMKKFITSRVQRADRRSRVLKPTTKGVGVLDKIKTKAGN